MTFSQETLGRLHISLGDCDAPDMAVYPPGGAGIDDAVLKGISRAAPDGSEQLELSIAVVQYDTIAVAFPLIDILKYALYAHPELVARAAAELKAYPPA